MTAPAHIQEIINQGGLFFVSHSGGKDSQAMYSLVSKMVPADQIIVVHADLGRVEWEGVQDHIHNTISHPLQVVTANFKDGSRKDFISMVKRRAQQRPDAAPWPSPKYRQCTSDLKRDPIHKLIRQTCNATGINLAVNCTGIRAEESPNRAKLNPFKLNNRISTASRQVWEWLPIHDWSTAEVFDYIAKAGQEPFWAYQENERLSCVFCIMGCKGDLQHGARQRPELAAELIALEESTGFTMFHGHSLADLITTDRAAA